MRAKRTLLPHPLLPLESVKIGRFIVDIHNPCLYSKHDPNPSYESQIRTTVREDYATSNQDDAGHGFKAIITSLLASNVSRRVKTDVRVEAETAKSYWLEDADRWYNEAMSKDETRSWVEETIYSDNKVYLIVGYDTVTNARFFRESIKGRETKGEVQAPVGIALAAAGAVVPIGDFMDPVVSAHKQSVKRTADEYKVLGEQICILYFLQVKTQLLSSRNLPKVYLKKTIRFEAYDRFRGEDDGVEDIIEVQLAEVENGDGEFDTLVVEDGEVLVSLS